MKHLLYLFFTASLLFFIGCKEKADTNTGANEEITTETPNDNEETGELPPEYPQFGESSVDAYIKEYASAVEQLGYAAEAKDDTTFENLLEEANKFTGKETELSKKILEEDKRRLFTAWCADQTQLIKEAESVYKD